MGSIETTGDGYQHADVMVRVAARALKAPGQGGLWRVTVGDVSDAARTAVEAGRVVAGDLSQIAGRAFAVPVTVVHDDGSLTLCFWFGTQVRQDRIRDGKRTCSTWGDWASPDDAVRDALEGFGPGKVVR